MRKKSRDNIVLVEASPPARNDKPVDSPTVGLPSDWTLRPLGDVLRLRKEVVHPRDNPRGRTTFVGLEHIESHTGRRIGAVDVEMAELTGRKPRFRTGDIVYGYLRPYLNKVWIAKFDGLCSVDQYVYHVNRELADAEFVAWFMRSPTYLRRAPIDTTPGQLPRIRTEEVAAVSVELPPLQEQRRIAARLREQLGEVARARVAVQTQISTAESLSAGLLNEVFDDSRTTEWFQCRLGDVLVRIDAGQCVNCESRQAQPSEWGVLKVSSVTWGEFREQENKVLPQGFVVPDGAEVCPGDFLISRSNTTVLVGAVVLVRQTRPRLMLSDKTLRLVPRKEAVSSEFLEFLLRSPRCRKFIEESAGGASSSMKNITQDAIRNIPIVLPRLEQQRQIASRLADGFAAARLLRTELTARSCALGRLPGAILSERFRLS